MSKSTRNRFKCHDRLAEPTNNTFYNHQAVNMKNPQSLGFNIHEHTQSFHP